MVYINNGKLSVKTAEFISDIYYKISNYYKIENILYLQQITFRNAVF